MHHHHDHARPAGRLPDVAGRRRRAPRPARAPPNRWSTVLRTIESGDVDTALVGHFDQEPIFLYPELDDRGWSHELRHRSLRRSGLRREVRAAPGAHAAMTLAASFLGGAKSRLLPASIPFRFFAAAAAFHVADVGRAADQHADEVAGLSRRARAAAGGGASVDVRRADHDRDRRQRAAAAGRDASRHRRRSGRSSWCSGWRCPGSIALVAGMYARQHLDRRSSGAVADDGRFAAVRGAVRRQSAARQRPSGGGRLWLDRAGGVVGLLVGSALALALDYEQSDCLPDHAAVALAHLILGGFGFMGMLALGFSHILVPMFALGAAPAKRPSRWRSWRWPIAAHRAWHRCGALADSRTC